MRVCNDVILFHTASQSRVSYQCIESRIALQYSSSQPLCNKSRYYFLFESDSSAIDDTAKAGGVGSALQRPPRHPAVVEDDPGPDVDGDDGAGDADDIHDEAGGHHVEHADVLGEHDDGVGRRGRGKHEGVRAGEHRGQRWNLINNVLGL